MGWSVGMYIHNNSISCSRYYAPSLNERLEVECYLQVGTLNERPFVINCYSPWGRKGTRQGLPQVWSYGQNVVVACSPSL